MDGEKQIAEQVLQSVREELAAEWDGRQKVEQERDDPIAARQEAEERMRDVLAAPGRPDPSPASPKRTSDPAGGSDKQMQVRRRGRPAKPDQSEAEFVEWWKPSWRDRIR